MPTNAHVFLTDYLDKVRWYDGDFIEQIEEQYSFEKYDVDVGNFHHLLKSCGYEHLVAHNLLIVIAVMALILLVWLVLAVKDLV